MYPLYPDLKNKEDEKIFDLLCAFYGYVEKHPEFDVFFSDKKGFLWLFLEDNTFIQVKTYDQMLRALLEEMISDQYDRYVETFGPEAAWTPDADALHADLAEILCDFHDNLDYALTVMDDCIEQRKA